MSDFKQFRVVDTGELVTYPAHYENHPVFGLNIEPYDEEEYEVDKVVVQGHELPVEQRVSLFVVENADEDDDEPTYDEEDYE